MPNTALLASIERLNEVGIALSSEHDTSKLLELIIENAMELTHADGGTLYLTTPEKTLKFHVIQNKTLNIYLGGTHSRHIPFGPLPLLNQDTEENLSTVATYVANKGTQVNISDIYSDENFDFSGALQFDRQAEYRTQSMLTIPLKNFDGDILGVLQLINAQAPDGQGTIAFSPEAETLAHSLASQASVALTNKQLIEEHKILFESFSQMVADAIDKKSPYTGEHCKRVPIITMMLAKAACEIQTGPFANFHMTDEELFELETAAWLHDCGKLATPEYIMDKSTKLETVFDRIELLESRLNAKAYQEVFEQLSVDEALLTQAKEKYQALFTRLRQINLGGERLKPEDGQLINQLQQQYYQSLSGDLTPLLSLDEADNLSIQRGTLNDHEREVMQDHAAMSIHMLNILPFPKGLHRVPEYAGGHHERMDGQGYPNHLTREQLSIPARMMGIADIFEALSARDRPYKQAKSLSESLHILGLLCEEGHIDPDLFELFVEQKVYLDYANQHMSDDQIDEVIHCKIPGYCAKVACCVTK